MTWQEYADTATSLYNKLLSKGWNSSGSNSTAIRMVVLYFTSGAYRNEPEPKPIEENNE